MTVYSAALEADDPHSSSDIETVAYDCNAGVGLALTGRGCETFRPRDESADQSDISSLCGARSWDECEERNSTSTNEVG